MTRHHLRTSLLGALLLGLCAVGPTAAQTAEEYYERAQEHEARGGAWVNNAAIDYYGAMHNGMTTAWYDLGRMAENGWGVAPSCSAAKEAFEKAADAGSRPAKDRLDYFTIEGCEARRNEPWQQAQAALEQGDTAAALPLLETAAERGVGEARHWLGDYYFGEAEAPADFRTALEYYRLALGGNHESNRASEMMDSVRTVAAPIAFERGMEAYRARDYDTAREWLSWTRYYDHPDYPRRHGAFIYGLIHARGWGSIEKDYETAADWYDTAKNAEHPSATNNLAYQHQHGLGMEEDLGMARALYSMATDYGNAAAAWNHAFVILQEPSGNQECEKVPELIRIATERGHDKASEWDAARVRREVAECHDDVRTGEIDQRREWLVERTDDLIAGLETDGWETLWDSGTGACTSWEGRWSRIMTGQRANEKYSTIRVYVAYPSELDPEPYWFMIWDDDLKAGRTQRAEFPAHVYNRGGVISSYEFMNYNPEMLVAPDGEPVVVGVRLDGECESLRAWYMGHSTQ